MNYGLQCRRKKKHCVSHPGRKNSKICDSSAYIFKSDFLIRVLRIHTVTLYIYWIYFIICDIYSLWLQDNSERHLIIISVLFIGIPHLTHALNIFFRLKFLQIFNILNVKKCILKQSAQKQLILVNVLRLKK